MKPKVSIILVTYNGGKKARRCLDSIKYLDYPNKEVVIVDNASIDNIPEYAESFGFNVLINKKNIGLSKAMNLGIKKSCSEYLLLLDQDVSFNSDMLTNLMKVMLKHNMGALAPMLYYYNRPDVINSYGYRISKIKGRCRIRGFNKVDEGQYKDLMKADCIQGAVFLVRRIVLEGAGFLEEKHFLFYIDTELCHDIWRAGYEIFVTTKAKAWHNSGAKENEINIWRER